MKLPLIIFLLGFFAVFAILSRVPFRFNVESSRLILTMRNSAKSKSLCRPATEAEKAKMLPHMRRNEICERTKEETQLQIQMDGAGFHKKTYHPLGLSSDGVTVAHEIFEIDPGLHSFVFEVVASNSPENSTRLEKKLYFESGRQLLVDFNNEKGFRVYGTDESGQ